MTSTSIPSGADFESALRYLDGELSETDEMHFEMRLSENPTLSAEFDRLAALNLAQRQLAALPLGTEASDNEPGSSNTTARPGRAETVRHTFQLCAALTAGMLGVASISWFLLRQSGGDPQQDGRLASSAPYIPGHFDSPNLPRGGEAGESYQLQFEDKRLHSEVFVIGIDSDGKLQLLPGSPDPESTPTAEPHAGVTYRPHGRSQLTEAIRSAVSSGAFTWPPAAPSMSRLVAGYRPQAPSLFMEELAVELARSPTTSISLLMEWLEGQGVEWMVFAVEK